MQVVVFQDPELPDPVNVSDEMPSVAVVLFDQMPEEV